MDSLISWRTASSADRKRALEIISQHSNKRARLEDSEDSEYLPECDDDDDDDDEESSFSSNESESQSEEASESQSATEEESSEEASHGDIVAARAAKATGLPAGLPRSLRQDNVLYLMRLYYPRRHRYLYKIGVTDDLLTRLRSNDSDFQSQGDCQILLAAKCRSKRSEVQGLHPQLRQRHPALTNITYNNGFHLSRECYPATREVYKTARRLFRRFCVGDFFAVADSF